MKLKDILPDSPLENIQARTNGPFGGELLFGYCHWTGTELISGDGDNYSVEDEISRYEFDEESRSLTYWFVSEWI